jgi:hypothetical protein
MYQWVEKFDERRRRSLLLNGLTSYDPAILIAGKEDWS